MPRTPKRGIDYAPWNTDIFENDTKIDALIDAQGWAGFSIYFYLCQKAYASDGYFYRWSYANAPTTARRMGGGIGSETVKQTVALCLRIGLFDSKLFDRENVLTSKGIQRAFLATATNRKLKQADQSLFLLSEKEIQEIRSGLFDDGRNTKEYQEWRAAVFRRDNYTCQICGQRGGTLNAHHIKRYRLCVAGRTDVSNGITLCQSCHREVHRREGR